VPDAAGRSWRRFLVLLRWRRHQVELREEIAQHHALKAREYEARGMSPADAAAAAARAMGNVTVARETARRTWGFQFAETVWQDLAYALRSMIRQPLFTAVAVLGLAGGLGFSSAAFSAFNTLALRGWEVPQRHELAPLYATSPADAGNQRASGFSYDQMQLLATRAQSLVGVFSYEKWRPDGTGSISASPVSAGYFDVLRIPMALGRGFRPEEDRIGAPTAVIVLSHAWWTTQRNAAPDVLGTIERVRGVPFTVIGVAAPGFGGTDLLSVDAWFPMTAIPLVRPRDRLSHTVLAQGDACCVRVIARLAPGVSRTDAAREVTALLAQTMRPGIDTLVRTASANHFTLVGVSGPNVGAEIAPIFLLIFGGVGVVLLLACANVANLLLARAAAREREIGIRLALGASRRRLLRQLMTESLLLALLAGLPALVIARWLPVWIMGVFTRESMALTFTPDVRVLGVTVGLAVASCVLFGLVPALHATRPLTTQRHRLPLRSVFLSAQVTFCVVLLVAAALFVRSAQAGRELELGFTHEGVHELMLSLPANEDEAARAQRLQLELPELVAAAGVPEAAFTEHPPFAVGSVLLTIDGEARHVASVTSSPDYFALMRIATLAGRPFGTGAAGANEVVVNALLAERLGGTAAILGRTLVVDSIPRTIVGVVRSARDAGDLRRATPAVYRPFAWRTSPRVLVRASAEQAHELARLMRARDGALGVSVRPYQWYIENVLSSATGAATMAGALGLLALVLASVGIFGVFSFWVRQRQRDIGIRMALGATRTSILRMVVGAAGRAVGWGLVIGVLLSAAVAQLLRSSLYGLSPFDPRSFGAAIGILLLAAFLATVLPAWRAVHVDPMESLRSD
jgi:predicted permease